MLLVLGLILVLVGTCRSIATRSAEDPKILILGAGMSGISAAKTLEDAGYNNIVILEGNSVIGGRMRTALLSDHTVELGAMWLYGLGTKNPMYKLLVDNGISMVGVEDTWTVRNSSGNDVTDLGDNAQVRFDTAIEAVDTDAADAVEKNLSDFTMRSRLRYYNWAPNSKVEQAVESFNINFEFGVPPDFLSSKHAYFWAPYEAFENDDIAIVNDQRGYQHLVEIMAAPFIQNGQSNSRIMFNSVVKQIKQTIDGVEILTHDGASYSGDYVIVTFSLGVLQNNDVVFSPDLPACKHLAIDKFEVTYLTQIYIEFPSTFWDDTSAILFASDQRGKYNSWINMNKVLPGSNILQVTLSGDESKRVERLANQVVMDEVVQHLRLMYPYHVIPSPTNFTMSRWTYDPFIRGAYTYWPTSFTENNMEDMMAPFGRIFFAGEHLDPVQYSYAHAAYASGIKTASDLILCLQDSRSCPTNIEATFQCSKRQRADECVSRAGLVVGSPVLVFTLAMLFN